MVTVLIDSSPSKKKEYPYPNKIGDDLGEIVRLEITAAPNPFYVILCISKEPGILPTESRVIYPQSEKKEEMENE